MERGADPHIVDEDDINALDDAIYGLPDIDNFTAGSCPTDTVRAILDQSPGPDAEREEVEPYCD